MITIYAGDFNGEVNQKSYDDILFSLDLSTLCCSFCGHYGMIVHGYYYRNIINKGGKERIRILRVRCPYCKKTHAVLISFIVPYSSVQLQDQIRIIRNIDIEALMIEKPQIDESALRRVLHNYNQYFRERMISFSISFDDALVEKCFLHFKRNFNQIHCGYNVLFTPNHTGNLHSDVCLPYS